MVTRFILALWDGAPQRGPLARMLRWGTAGYVLRGQGTLVVQEVRDEPLAFSTEDLALFSRFSRWVGTPLIAAMYSESEGSEGAVLLVYADGRERLRWQWPGWAVDAEHLHLEAGEFAHDFGAGSPSEELLEALAGSGEPLADLERSLSLLGRPDIAQHLRPGTPAPPGARVARPGPRMSRMRAALQSLRT